MSYQGLLAELLISGFFAVACFRARAVSPSFSSVTPSTLFQLTNRIERLRRSRWQWCCVLMLLIVLRMQVGMPLIAELTGAAQFLVFLALPTARQTVGA